VVKTFADISVQVRLRAMLGESERRYRLLAENSADIVMLIEDGRIAWVSPSVTHVLGWAPDEWIAHDRGTFLHPDDQQAMVAEAARLEPGVPQRARRRVRARDGGYHWVDVQVRIDPSEGAGRGAKVLALRVVDAEVVARDVEHRASHDPLTGCSTAPRPDRLACTLGDAATQGHVTGVACDVDDFKVVNACTVTSRATWYSARSPNRLRERLRRGRRCRAHGRRRDPRGAAEHRVAAGPRHDVGRGAHPRRRAQGRRRRREHRRDDERRRHGRERGRPSTTSSPVPTRRCTTRSTAARTAWWLSSEGADAATIAVAASGRSGVDCGVLRPAAGAGAGTSGRHEDLQDDEGEHGAEGGPQDRRAGERASGTPAAARRTPDGEAPERARAREPAADAAPGPCRSALAPAPSSTFDR
jgi:PAS domain S-box-containing protein